MAKKATAPTAGTLGTFAGVFTPSILTILGIILFLRMGYVVGAGGVGQALLIILLANVISVLTSISLSTIATNLRVKGGGDYYLISRTLGVEFGGAIGIVLFLAQAVSIAFYAIGFGEAVGNILSTAPSWLPQAVAAGAVAVLFLLAWLGADVATRFQFVVMAVLGIAITAFFVGGIPSWSPDLARQNWTASSDVSFWVLFAIFFPAVTGFTQGVSMSGDLKDPSRSLPLGTFVAVGLSAVVYVGVAIVFAGTVPGDQLVSNLGAMRDVSVLPWLVDAGVISATLSSALASFLGGPRILQSMARDHVFPWLVPFGVGHGPSENPRRAVLLAAAIAFATIAIGELDLVAPVVSMFFLVSYGLLNYATFFEAQANSPSFRPTFRYFDPRLSLLGGLACLGAMLAIHPAAGIVAVTLLFAIFQYLRRTVGVARWSDSSLSHLFQEIRHHLHALSAEIAHPKDWRPILLAFTDDPARRERLMRFAAWIEGGAGLTTAVQVTEGTGAVERKRRLERQTEMADRFRHAGLDAFALTVTCANRGDAIATLLQAFGIGPIRANTVLLNWFDHRPDPGASPALPEYGQYLRTALRFGCNLVVLDTTTDEMAAFEATPPGERRIDVWYADDANGQLMLLLAHLMTRSTDWEHGRLRVLVPTHNGGARRSPEAVEQMLAEYRIDGEPVLVERLDVETVTTHSGDATFVWLPFTLDGDVPTSPFDAELGELLQGLPLTALVLAAQEIDLDAEPDEGRHQEIASAVDAATAARDRSARATEAAAAAEQEAATLRARLEEARAAAADAETIERLTKEVERAELEATDLKRRAVKVESKAAAATLEADAATGQSPTDPGASGES